MEGAIGTGDISTGHGGPNALCDDSMNTLAHSTAGVLPNEMGCKLTKPYTIVHVLVVNRPN